MSKQHANSKNEQGYMLLAVMLLLTLMLVALSIELPRISQQIRRSREEELVHRGEQYKMAIKRFVRKNGRYPASIEQLDNTNQIRYLRKHYKDPMTGKDEWRILHVGEVQLNAGNGQLQTAGGGGNNPFGAPGSMGTNSGFGSSGGTGGTGSTGTMGTPGITGSSGGTGTTGSTGSNTPGPTVGPSTTSGPGSGSFGTGNVQFGGAGIIGVTSTSKEKSIKERNGKDHYNEWLFVYDPRLDATTQPGVPGAGGVGTPIGGQGGPGAGGIGGPGPGGTGGPGGRGGPGPVPH